MFRTLSQGDSISEALRKLLQGGRRGSHAIYKFATKGAGSLNIKDQVIKLRNLAFYVWEDAGRWAHWVHSFHMHFSYLVQSCFLVHLASCIPPAPQQLLWGVAASSGSVFGVIIHIWRQKIADSCGISCWLIWKDIFSFHISICALIRTGNLQPRVLWLERCLFETLLGVPPLCFQGFSAKGQTSVICSTNDLVRTYSFCLTEILCPLSPHFPHLPALHHSILWFYEFDYFWYLL